MTRRLTMALRRLRSLFFGGAADADMDEEIRAHLDHLVAENRAAGMDPAAARAAALRSFGGVAQVAEACRDARGWRWLASAPQDLVHGVRLLRRAPGFTAAAVLTIALGMGATTAIFSLVYSVLLRPLPFGEPERLVVLWTTAPRLGLTRAFAGAANARDWQQHNGVFEDVALVRTIANFNLVGEGEPVRLLGARVTANLFPLLRVSPLLGRAFTAEENVIGRQRVVLLSHGLWQRRFGGDPAVVGRTVSLSGEPHVVVGVMGPDFRYPGREFELWVPLTVNPDDYRTRMNYAFVCVARLKPGVTLAAAQADMDVLSARLAARYPETNTQVGAEVAPMLDATVAAVKRPLYVLLAAVGAMLLIGCANLANLLLSRALARRKDVATRAALGASRSRLVAQALTETVPLLLLGGGLGLAVARVLLGVLVPLLPAEVPRVEAVGLHVPVLLFTAAALGGIALLTGLYPAVEAARASLGHSVSDLSRTTAAPNRTRFRDALVVAQIALTLVLAVGASLLMRSFAGLKGVDPGFSPERVTTLHLAIPRQKYPQDRDVSRFCQQVLERVRAVPDVVSAGMVNRLPLAGGIQSGSLQLEGTQGTIEVPTDWRTATPDYFRTLQIPLRHGRDFTERDDENAPVVGIIDERLAALAWPGETPLGRRFRIGPDMPWTTVVGIAGHIHHDRLDQDSRPQVYWNYHQRGQDRMALVVKTRGEARGLETSLAALVRAVDPEQPVYDVRTLDAVVDRSLAPRWLQTTLVGVFAALALLLASIGVYGVMSYAVGQRQREFGVRLALGARRRDIADLVLRRGAALFAWGAALGLLGAAGAVRVLASLLYGVSRFDPVSFAAALLVLLGVSAAACGVPARRAARVDPAATLRDE
jgi:putative ABC transport system permease protein